MDDILSAAIEAAKAAGDIALHYFRTNLTVETKAGSLAGHASGPGV
jgi:hypothetical protein